MIEIIKEKPLKKKITPYYILKYNYMIGDSNGYTDDEINISKDNPYIEKYCKLLNKLKPTKGTWGLCLNSEDIKKCYKEKQITKDEYLFLLQLMFEDSNEFQTETRPLPEDDFSYEFFEGVRYDTEYSFLVFQGVELFYIDENKKKHETKIK